MDDQEGNLLALEILLRPHPCEVISFQSGQKALDYLAFNETALILLDVKMPIMDGFEVAQRVRKIPQAKLTPIIFITGMDQSEAYINKAYEAGGTDFIIKPINEKVLSSKVAIFLELFKARAQIVSEDKLRNMISDLKLKSDAIENSLNGFDIVDEDGKLIYVNQAYLRMWGFDRAEEVIGTSPAGHCADPDTPRQIMMQLKTNGQCDIEFVAKRKDGSTFDVRMLAFVAHDPNGKEIYPTTSVDISAAKRSEERLQQAKEEAEKANELKSSFLANMSHEIRTPLGAMLGFADLLRDPHISREDHQNYLDILARNGEQLSFIINDILDISKVEAGHFTLDFLSVNPKEIAAEVLTLLKVKAQAKRIDLEYLAEKSTPDQVLADPIRVRQVLINLVNNGIKFTEKGSVKFKSYGFKNERNRNMVAFEITDTGMGVSPHQQSSIFEMFIQGDGSLTRKYGGTGIGLALSRKLARAHHGDVTLKESVLNQGSTFVFTFEDQTTI